MAAREEHPVDLFGLGFGRGRGLHRSTRPPAPRLRRLVVGTLERLPGFPEKLVERGVELSDPLVGGRDQEFALGVHEQAILGVDPLLGSRDGLVWAPRASPALAGVHAASGLGAAVDDAFDTPAGVRFGEAPEAFDGPS